MSTSFDRISNSEVDVTKENRIVVYVPPPPAVDYTILAPSTDVPEAQYFERESVMHISAVPGGSGIILWIFSPVQDGRHHTYTVTITTTITTMALVQEYVTARSTITVLSDGVGNVNTSISGDTLVVGIPSNTVFTTFPDAVASGSDVNFRIISDAVDATDAHISVRIEVHRTM